MKKRLGSLFRNRYFRIFLFLVLVFAAFIVLSNIWIIRSTRDRIYTDASAVPANDVALLLGASKNAFGGENFFFRFRIEAAALLYRSGKIKHIIVSGDNHTKGYDEATDMRDALMAEGVPESAITLDYAGFRTLDSVVRCQKIFGQNKITIISQEFHNQRALFIARKYGIDAVGFNAKDVPSHYAFKTKVREYFAKFKAVLDLYVFHTQPRFLGDPVKIQI